MASSRSTTKTDPGKSTKTKSPKSAKRRAYPTLSDSSDSSDGSDRSGDDSVVPGSSTWTRPRGIDPEEVQYRGWLTWTPGQWAWEFLRRNSDFQKACAEVTDRNALPDRVAEKFHLARFKDYREGYDNNSPLFARSIKVFPRRTPFEERLKAKGELTPGPIKTYAPRDNEVIITFSLEPGTLVGPKILKRQLEQAKSRLEAYLKILRKERSSGSGSQTLDPEDLINKLRALDLAADNQLTADIADALALVKGARDMELAKLQRRLTKLGSKCKREAEELAAKGYMKLAVADVGTEDAEEG